MNNPINPEIVVAHSQCLRKAYLLLCTKTKGTPHEYMLILEEEKNANRERYLQKIASKASVQPYNGSLKGGSDFVSNAMLMTDDLEATCDLLTKVDGKSALGRYRYEPTIVVGTHNISKSQRLRLFFVGYVLGKAQNRFPETGRIIDASGKSHKIKLGNSEKTILPVLESLREWKAASGMEPPPVILNKHCPSCQFQSLCRSEAEREDNLSLLDRISTARAIRKYEKKGIFTVRQLSYIFKPRRRKKRARKQPLAHKPELQALAIRTGKIYLQEVPEIHRHPVELFLDMEGIPDQDFYYLIGLLICQADESRYISFWADQPEEEGTIWLQFLEEVKKYPEAPLYHYGSFEQKAVTKLSRRYETDGSILKSRLINVNTYIYGRIYFPVRSNGLKDIGRFVGATWSSKDASGLQSLVWRHHWEETQNPKYRELLVTYNGEDCKALHLLTDELTRIKDSADTLSEVDFADQPKRWTTEIGEEVHSQFKAILRFAHADYDNKKISLQQDRDNKDNGKLALGAPKGHQGCARVNPKPNKIIHVPCKRKCPNHSEEVLQASEKAVEKTIIDLVFTKSGVRKSVTKYIGVRSYCKRCNRYYIPPDIQKLGNFTFGRSFQAWVVYQRLFLRLPYRVLIQTLEDQFKERISEGTVINFIKRFSDYYSETEQILRCRILENPFIHVDETIINIEGIDHYVWVFTDGIHVILKMTETREATIVHDILSNYDGILVSDFYPGYDSVKCQQQKCWVHLIRDLNDDLWKAPFDREFEIFVSEVRNLILPILQAVEKYGLKKRNLNKFRKEVDRFYEKVIADKIYKSELVLKYQKRFTRYRDSLFVFLQHNGIPWNNNMAERALRHLAVQRKISRTFYESVAPQYLRLLSIMQTCRFQDKSFLKFLLSGMTDIDSFTKTRRVKNSRPVRKK